jgi:hypothetical protein
MDHHRYPHRREPNYGVAGDQTSLGTCMTTGGRNNWSWLDCNGPTKSLAGRKL